MASVPIFYSTQRNAFYVASHVLGGGGQGTVWAGTWSNLPVAIKVQSDFSAWDREQSILLKCLGHPCIVTAYDQFRNHDGSLVLVMELAECSAQDHLNKGRRFTAKEVCRIGADLASALERIHSEGIRHRDLKPMNVLCFAGDKFKLGDFGIARDGMATDDLAMTQIGTPGWFPPEVLKGNGSTPSSDVYQLGLVLLSLLLGKNPAQNHQQVLDGIPRQAAERLVATNTHGETARIIQWMLPRTPHLRHANAAAVRQKFEAEYNAIVQREIAAAITRHFPPATGITGLAAAAQRNRNSLAALGGINPPPQRPLSALGAMNPPQPHSALSALAHGGLNPPPPHSAFAAALPRGGLNPPPQHNALARSAGVSKVANALVNARRQGLPGGLLGFPPMPQVPQAPKQSPVPLFSMADPLGVEGIFGALPPQPQLNAPSAGSSAALGGLLGLGALAAFSSGEKPLAGLLGLGALAALSSNEKLAPQPNYLDVPGSSNALNALLRGLPKFPGSSS